MKSFINMSFLSLEMSASIFSLLDLLQNPLLPEKTNFKIKRHVGGNTFYDKSKHLGDYQKKISSGNINSLEIEAVIDKVFVWDGIYIHSVGAKLFLSPQSSAWLDVEAWSAPKTRGDIKQRVNTLTKASFIVDGEVIPYPTFLTLDIAFSSMSEDKLSNQQVYSALKRHFDRNMPAIVKYGYGEVSTKSYLVPISFTLRSWPRTYQMLGEKIDALHQIILANGGTCVLLANNIGGVIMQREGSNKLGNELTLIFIDEKEVKDPAQTEKVAFCIIPRDETTARPEVLKYLTS